MVRMLVPLFRLGLGAQLGNGEQWLSWIHVLDEAHLALFAVENMDVAGALNAAAPTPVRNAEFTRTLATVLRRRAFLRLPSFLLRATGEFSEELLSSKRVVPQKAIDQQFGFRFPELRGALDDLLA
jgi:NAD dependent epimerase/dehydratase family enzyme